MKFVTFLFFVFLFYIFIIKDKNETNLNIGVSFLDYPGFKSLQTKTAESNFINDPLQKLEDLNDQAGSKLYQNISDISVAESCGKEKFPLGVFVNPVSQSPTFYCVSHQCSTLDTVKCYIKNVEPGQGCSGTNEWISGFIVKNNSRSIECCRYKNIRFTAFIKTIYLSESQIYVNEWVAKNETLAEIDFINNIRKIETLEEDHSVFRMKCMPAKEETNFAENLTTNGPPTFSTTPHIPEYSTETTTTTVSPPSSTTTTSTTVSPATTTTLKIPAATYSTQNKSNAITDVTNKSIVLRLEKSPNLIFKKKSG